MAPSKPSLLIVPGAGHDASHWDDTKQRLEALSFDVTCRSLPTVGDASKSWPDDRDFLLELIGPEMDKGKEFVIIAHSYGSVPSVALCQGRSVKEREAAGMQGGIRAIILVASGVVVHRGLSVADSFEQILKTAPGQWPRYFDPHPDGLAYATDYAREDFYPEIGDEEAAKFVARLKGHSIAPFMEPMNEYATEDLTVPSFYMICANDSCIPPVYQHYVCDHVPGMKSKVFDSGHSPYLSIPDQFVRYIEECVEASR